MLLDFLDILNTECFSGIDQGRIPYSPIQFHTNFMRNLYITKRNTVSRENVCTAGNKSPTPPTTSQSHLQPTSTNNQKHMLILNKS